MLLVLQHWVAAVMHVLPHATLPVGQAARAGQGQGTALERLTPTTIQTASAHTEQWHAAHVCTPMCLLKAHSPAHHRPCHQRGK